MPLSKRSTAKPAAGARDSYVTTDPLMAKILLAQGYDVIPEPSTHKSGRHWRITPPPDHADAERAYQYSLGKISEQKAVGKDVSRDEGAAAKATEHDAARAANPLLPEGE